MNKYISGNFLRISGAINKYRKNRLLIKSGSLIIAFCLLSLCEKATIATNIPKSTELPYTTTENLIRSKFDIISVFKWEEYTKLLDKLSGEKFIILPINEMRSTYDKSKVIIGLRHDVDFNPFKALEMAHLEKMYGIRATYYFLATAEYYGKITEKGLARSTGIEYLIKEIYNTGSEIGIHNDLLSIQFIYNQDPFIFNKKELKFYKSLNIPIYGTAAHGNPSLKQPIPNYEVFSDFAKNDSATYRGNKYPLGQHSLKQFGFKYEAYFIDFGIYFSESGGKWNDPDGLNGILKKLDLSKPGDRIQILTHPDWWGKAY